MRYGTPIVVILACAIVVSEAHARCARPGPVLIPSSGAVPVAGTVYALVPTVMETTPPTFEVRLSGTLITPTITPEKSASPNLKAFSVKLPQSKPGRAEIVMTIDGSERGRWSLDITSTYRVQPPAKATPTLSRVATHWTCSHELSTRLTFAGSAPGYRILLADTQANLRNPSRVESVFLPQAPEAFFGSQPSGDADLRLGHLNCFGETYSFQSRPRWVEIHALLPDGSEPVVTTAPIEVPPP